MPSLFAGGAAFPGNDWTVSPRGEEYLSRIPAAEPPGAGAIRGFHLGATREVLRKIERHDNRSHDAIVSFGCK